MGRKAEVTIVQDLDKGTGRATRGVGFPGRWFEKCKASELGLLGVLQEQSSKEASMAGTE